jgi:hypothetical protein
MCYYVGNIIKIKNHDYYHRFYQHKKTDKSSKIKVDKTIVADGNILILNVLTKSANTQCWSTGTEP